MFRKMFRKTGRWMSLGAVLGGATMFSAAGQGCSSEDTAALLALLQAASQIVEEDCDCGDSQLPGIPDGTSNTILLGENNLRQ